ncbi:hypothetical protein [Rhizosaccharibacter radicis]|uniref:CheW-like domain-containing protein n=1 Tax=Rhizosaccharibacter radicis TaxID=2782605 RepID=A0ABT1VX75_9PROT|nr:hypothetical protein [Acetobacteraceae bacterium KSS12]
MTGREAVVGPGAEEALSAARRDRLLAERAANLARRGLSSPVRRLPPRLLCVAGSHLVGLDPALVAGVRPARWWPLFPGLGDRRGSGGRALLGLFGHEGQVGSLFELAVLLGDPSVPPPEDGEAAGTQGSMILLHRHGSIGRTALRADAVIGLQALRPLAEPAPDTSPGQPQGAALDDEDRLVTLPGPELFDALRGDPAADALSAPLTAPPQGPVGATG